jgi:hypothetical protein
VPAADEDVRAARERRVGRGGRPAVHDWRPFTTEIIRIAALDGGETTKSELKRRMKAWADLNMESVPEDRTLERKVDELVADVFSD